MRIVIGCDHAGYDLKQELDLRLRQSGHDLYGVGANTFIPTDDYPDYAHKVADAVATGAAERGIILCGSGVGASIVANKVRGVRAAVSHDTYSAHQGVEHDDMNVLCIGSRIVGSALAWELVSAFLAARFSGEDRHVRRLRKIAEIEQLQFLPPSQAKEA